MVISSNSTVSDLHTEYSTFLHPTFDPNTFAHSIINNKPYPSLPISNKNESIVMTPSLSSNNYFKNGLNVDNINGMGGNSSSGSGSGSEVNSALVKLNFSIEELTRQLKSEITKHHSSLLFQAASLSGLDGDLNAVRRGLAEVEAGVTKLRKKITIPHTSLSTSLTLLTRLRRASSLARRSSRFTVLARRLENQMNEIDGVVINPISGESNLNLNSSIGPGSSGGERTTAEKRERAMAEAALTLAEIQLLLNANDEGAALDDPEALLPIRSIRAVEISVPAVESSRQRVVEEMESTVQRGLDDLDNPLLASSLQTAHNLSVLPSLVESLVQDLVDIVAKKVKSCFDMTSLAKELNAKDAVTSASAFVYKSRARNEPTNVTLPLWTSTMWTRIDNLINDLGDICIRVYTLEKVLKLKKDTNTQASFLDEAMTLLENKPSLMFWTSLSQAFELQAKESTKSSTFIQNIFSTGYPRLLRLIHAFFLKITVHTDTIYTHAQQSPETILLLRSLSPFETLYLQRSTNRLTEIVASSFSISSNTSSLSASFSSRPPTAPTANEGLATARAIVNELDAARFDPILVKSIAKGAKKALDTYVLKAASLVANDHSSTSLLGPLKTVSQGINSDLASSLYHLWKTLLRSTMGGDHSEVVKELLRGSIESTRTAYLSIGNPLIMSIRREFSSIITRMHRVDYSKNKVDPNSNPMMNNSASAYMIDLIDKLTLIRDEILSGYRVDELAKEWALELARFTVQTFVLHASIVKPLGEAGKLKLTSDTTSLEFAISQYLSSHGLSLTSMGDQFKALRAFRPLLFLSDDQLSLPKYTSDVPTLILLHHILSRCKTIPLPHQVHKWTEAEYVKWLNEHGEKDRIKIVEGVLKGWEEKREKSTGKEGKVVVAGEEEDVEFMKTLRTILDRE